jgi:predicted ester cyclase
MALEENKRVVRRFFEELFGTGNLNVLDELVAPHAVHAASTSNWEPGREGFRKHVLWIHNAYPDMHLTVEELVAEGEQVVVFFTIRGTHQGEFWGVQPTGRHIVLNAVSRLRVLNGQVCHCQFLPDRLGILIQLGNLGRHTEQFAQAPTTSCRNILAEPTSGADG